MGFFRKRSKFRRSIPLIIRARKSLQLGAHKTQNQGLHQIRIITVSFRSILDKAKPLQQV